MRIVSLPRLRFGLVEFVVLVFCGACLAAEPKRATGPWDVERILDTPASSTTDVPGLPEGQKSTLVSALRYRSEPYQGRDCWVFAYYGRPEGDGPFPAMLLVHGGGGKAFAEWAELWARRGYVALAMDLAGNGPDGKPMADGGPPQDNEAKFRPFDDHDLRDTWPYQAVAAVLRGHALLAARPEVDRERIGITGISWGGYLTCIVAGIDNRLKVAVPVYGCGFLGDNSAWLETFAGMTPEVRERWLSHFDPSRYLAGVRAPILFVNGTNDFAYPLDSYQKSYELVKSPRTLSITVNMPHGHPPGWAPAEIGAFVDSVLKGGEPLLKVSSLDVAPNAVTATCEGGTPLAKAELHYTTDTGRWQERQWTDVAVAFEAGTKRIRAVLPKERPLVCFMTATDTRGLTVSTPHVVLAGP